MRLIAAGRVSEIFDLGDGRVLRRFKAGGDPAREAAVMEHARTATPLRAAAAFRLADPNVTGAERESVRQLVHADLV